MIAILLLVISNCFMTVAWYGHLKYKDVPLPKVILISWGIALFEYIFQVPANRIGSNTLSATQLKIIQEVISLITFVLFALYYLDEPIKWNYVVSFLLVIGAVYFAFAFK